MFPVCAQLTTASCCPSRFCKQRNFGIVTEVISRVGKKSWRRERDETSRFNRVQSYRRLRDAGHKPAWLHVGDVREAAPPGRLKVDCRPDAGIVRDLGNGVLPVGIRETPDA